MILAQTIMVYGHDVSWAPEGSYIDLTEAWDIPVALVEHPDPDLYQKALDAGMMVWACHERYHLIIGHFNYIDPGRCSVRRDLLAACDAARNGTHAQRDAALDALLASVRD